jgi:hypothetical protein
MNEYNDMREMTAAECEKACEHAYDVGYRAGRFEGTNNPFDQGTMMWNEWERGYTDGSLEYFADNDTFNAGDYLW